jgi:hypothetical protein
MRNVVTNIAARLKRRRRSPRARAQRAPKLPFLPPRVSLRRPVQRPPPLIPRSPPVQQSRGVISRRGWRNSPTMSRTTR